MVENTVEHDVDIMFVEGAANFRKILICPKPAVDLFKITGVITMIVGFENRIQQDRIYSQIPQIFRPVHEFADSGNAFAVIAYRCSAESNWIDLIKYTIICPHIKTLLLKIMYNESCLFHYSK